MGSYGDWWSDSEAEIMGDWEIGNETDSTYWLLASYPGSEYRDDSKWHLNDQLGKETYTPIFADDGYADTEDYEEALSVGEKALSSGQMGIMMDTFVDGFGNTIKLYSTFGASDPTIETEEDDEGETYTSTFSYDGEEEAALEERFGSTIGISEDELQEGLEDIINTLVEEMAATTTLTQFTFKKVRYGELDYDNLSSFEETEATQTVATSLVQTTEGTY